MLKLEKIHKSFEIGTVNEKHILKGVNLEVNDGDFITIIGGNGAGKSTLLNSVAGTFPVTSGKIFIDGDDVTAEPEFKRAKYIGRVFQDTRMGTASDMSIEQNLAIAYRRGKKRTLRWGITERERGLYRELLSQLDLGLEHRLKDKTRFLSGGQRQALTLLMASFHQPKLLLLDEPFAAIDAKVRQELRSWLREMITRVGITSIFVTHDQDEAIEVADEIIITNHGHIEQAGTPIEIYSQPKTPFVTEFMGSPTRISNITSFHGYEQLCEGFHAVVRPEHVSVTKETEQSRFSSSVEEGVVERVMFRGREVELHVRVHDVLLVANRRLEETPITEGERVNVFIYQVFAFLADEAGMQNVQIVENANIETEKLFYI